MSVPTIDPLRAKQLLDEGALLVDAREAREHARERVPGALNNPLSRLSAVECGEAKAAIFHCRSGRRTRNNAERLAAIADCKAYMLAGGIEAWKRAGLPVVSRVGCIGGWCGPAKLLAFLQSTRRAAAT